MSMSMARSRSRSRSSRVMFVKDYLGIDKRRRKGKKGPQVRGRQVAAQRRDEPEVKQGRLNGLQVGPVLGTVWYVLSTCSFSCLSFFLRGGGWWCPELYLVFLR